MIKTRRELIKYYIDFFKKKGHKEIPPASLIPENDPTVLFITAGMHPLVPYLLGQKHPLGKRIVSVQKCVRTTDIDSVGDSCHHTFFEMLGNWSLGDYWKKEAIEWSYEFLTRVLKLDKNKLAITCFGGDKRVSGLPVDNESSEIWVKLGIPKERIAFLGGGVLESEKNWWGPAGKTGPCGPDTEMFYWIGKEKTPKKFNPEDSGWVEIWNDVFMEYNRTARIILVDGMGCIYDEGFKINEKLANIIGKFNAQKILLVNGFKERGRRTTKDFLDDAFSLEERGIKKDNPEFFRIFLEKYNIKPEEIIYFDHSKDNIKSAESLGIKSRIYKDKNDIEKFISENLYYFARLKQKNVDTGMGVERTLAVINGLSDNYMTEIWQPIIKKLEELSKMNYAGHEEKMRIIADHIKASVFIIADGVQPSNTGQGYVLRRLIRRVVRHGKRLGLKKFTDKIAEPIFEIYSDYHELKENENKILKILREEEDKFNKTIEKGLMIFNKIIIEAMEKKGVSKSKIIGTISGKDAFLLYQSYGFPPELIEEEARNRKLKFDRKEFESEYEKHQELSRSVSAGIFKSGLADESEKTTKLHTVTHLLNEALRRVLGAEVKQKGSNITSERLRFDFNFSRKLTEDEIKNVEELVNKKIKEGLDVIREEMLLSRALGSGAQAEFGARYPEIVSVYTVLDKKEKNGWFSKEICTGPHVKNTKEIGKFKIIKEEGIATGVRRIKALVE